MLNNRPDGEEYSNDSPSENAASEQANSLTFRRLNVLIVVLLSLLVGNQVWERIQEYRTQKAIEQWADQASSPRALIRLPVTATALGGPSGPAGPAEPR
ncbi:MAG: hypothetical protein AAF446_07220, partial [Pseudomonadota bacterium]